MKILKGDKTDILAGLAMAGVFFVFTTVGLVTTIHVGHVISVKGANKS
jgi:hypothetical protein